MKVLLLNCLMHIPPKLRFSIGVLLENPDGATNRNFPHFYFKKKKKIVLIFHVQKGQKQTSLIWLSTFRHNVMWTSDRFKNTLCRPNCDNKSLGTRQDENVQRPSTLHRKDEWKTHRAHRDFHSCWNRKLKGKIWKGFRTTVYCKREKRQQT